MLKRKRLGVFFQKEHSYVGAYVVTILLIFSTYAYAYVYVAETSHLQNFSNQQPVVETQDRPIRIKQFWVDTDKMVLVEGETLVVTTRVENKENSSCKFLTMERTLSQKGDDGELFNYILPEGPVNKRNNQFELQAIKPGQVTILASFFGENACREMYEGGEAISYVWAYGGAESVSIVVRPKKAVWVIPSILVR